MANTPRNEYVATGRRKTSVARVRLTPGAGLITVNQRSLDQYISVPTLRRVAIQPLEFTDNTKKFDVLVTVAGGGITGQAGAIRLGIARALVMMSPDLRKILRDKHLLTRDSRMKERKKYGQPGARKRFQFSKR